jgi:hypothetical protein
MEEAPPRGLPPSWADIPVDLAGLVLGRLPAHVDRVRFAAVCPQWRAAARQRGVPPPMPMLLLPDATVYSLPGSKPFHFSGCMGYTDACGTGNWLVFSGEDDRYFLKDPFSKDTVTLPALTRYRLRKVNGKAGRKLMETNKGQKLDAPRIIFCSPHLIAAIFNFQRVGIARIAVCQPGLYSWWNILDDVRLFVDILFHQGKLYAFNCMDALFSVDISVDHNTGDPCVSQIQKVIDGLHTCHHIFLPDGLLIKRVNYLVETRGALLLVCREMDLRLKAGNWAKIEVLEAEETRFEVYEANFDQSQWARVTTLGDGQVLFLGGQICRSVNVSCKEMPGDRIFFMDIDHRKGASSSCSVYDMTDGKVSTPLPMVSWKSGEVFATWLLP